MGEFSFVVVRLSDISQERMSAINGKLSLGFHKGYGSLLYVCIYSKLQNHAFWKADANGGRFVIVE